MLKRTPFSADTLDAQLQHERVAFFARPQNFRIDAATRTVWLSEILDFYTEDFVPQPAAGLIDDDNRFAPQPAPLDFTVRVKPYDWTVSNSRRAARQPGC